MMRKFKWIILAVLVAIVLVSGVLLAEEPENSEYVTELEDKLAADPENVALLKELGVYYHGLADKGDKQAVKTALEYFKKAMELAPEDNAIKAWYGSVLTMVARDSINPLTKYFKVKEGMKYLDDAVAAEPDSYEIRIARAMTIINIPNEIFGRIQDSIDDFAYVLNKDKAEPGYLPDKERQMSYLNIGIALKIAGNLETAIQVWEKLIEIAPDSEEAREAEKLLEKYSF